MRVVPSLVASAVVMAWLGGSTTALAADPSPTGKGIVGGGLLGAELVLAIEAALDVQSPWAYVGGGVAGAAAGAVGGYFVEQNATPRVPILLLAGGLVLAIPTTVAVLSATSYEPPATFVQDQPPADEPVADPAAPAQPAPAPASPAVRPVDAPTLPPSSSLPKRKHVARRALPPALIDFTPTQVSLSVPAVEIREVFSRAEVAMGAPKATEVRIPVVNIVF